MQISTLENMVRLEIINHIRKSSRLEKLESMTRLVQVRMFVGLENMGRVRK